VSLRNIGLADVAMFEGRYGDAERILTEAIPIDRAERNVAGGAAKLVALAEAQLALGKHGAAGASARAALELWRDESVSVPVARVLAATGGVDAARQLAAQLAAEIQPLAKAYARVIEAELALATGDPRDAIVRLREGMRLADVWLIRFDLGRAYVAAGHAAEALSELETAAKRRGEATALFLNDLPTYRYLAEQPYWLGRAQEALQMRESARQNLQQFIAIRSAAPADPLVGDARRRLASLQ
jgi:tetratricopeptide (TPR) repeat protein